MLSASARGRRLAATLPAPIDVFFLSSREEMATRAAFLVRNRTWRAFERKGCG